MELKSRTPRSWTLKSSLSIPKKILGAIKLGAGSAAEKVSGVVGTLANALAFDQAGNLYLAETGIGGGQFEPPIRQKAEVSISFPLPRSTHLPKAATRRSFTYRSPTEDRTELKLHLTA